MIRLTLRVAAMGGYKTSRFHHFRQYNEVKMFAHNIWNACDLDDFRAQTPADMVELKGELATLHGWAKGLVLMN